MRINNINPISVQTKSTINVKRYGTMPVTVSFKGENGQQVGSTLGMLAGVAASFVVGPLAALAISGIGLLSGAVAGDKIEDKIEDNKKNKHS